MSPRSLCVLFPGIGYTCDKPLLYYAAKAAIACGYSIRSVPYNGFPQKVRGDAERLQESLELARTQAETLLSDVSWKEWDRLLFIGKSIGTVVAARYAKEHGLAARLVLLTPLEETFHYACGDAIAFHGTSDPWAETSVIQDRYERQSIQLYLTEGANHSLETGHLSKDLETLQKTTLLLQNYIDS